MRRELGVEPLRNLGRLRIGPGVVTKTEGETHGWAAVQLWQGLVLLPVLLLVLGGEKRTALSVPLHVVMQGLSLRQNDISPVPPNADLRIPNAGGEGQIVNPHAGWKTLLEEVLKMQAYWVRLLPVACGTANFSNCLPQC